MMKIRMKIVITNTSRNITRSMEMRIMINS